MKKTLAALILGALALTACGSDAESNPAPESDSQVDFKDGSTIPVDKNVYLIQGEVIGEVNETTRQVSPAEGSISGSQYYVSGSFTGPITDGKGFVRIRVQKIDPVLGYAPVGDVVILKTSDTKAKALLNGDVVQFKCRSQYEAVAAILKNERFDETKFATYELDYCRLAAPVITVNTDGSEVKP